MSLTLHNLAPNKGAHTKSFRIGRGISSGRGKTSGRGTKGQLSRTGGGKGLALKGMKQMLLAFPKLRGFTSQYASAATVSVGSLEQFKEGTIVTLEVLHDAGLIHRSDRKAKIVGGGELTKKLTVKGVMVTAGARAAIEKVGGACVAAKRSLS